jgi:hypothetical protein
MSLFLRSQLCRGPRSPKFTHDYAGTLPRDFQHLPPVSLIPVVRFNLRVFEKTRDDPNS